MKSVVVILKQKINEFKKLDYESKMIMLSPFIMLGLFGLYWLGIAICYLLISIGGVK